MFKLNQKGAAQLLMTVITLGGIVAGVYLVQNPVNFSPKAYVSKSVNAFVSPAPSASCQPRPGCLDASPPCLRNEPLTGWCPTPSPTPSPTPTKRVFATSTTYTGNLGRLEGADAKCQERASAVNLGGVWKAWLSDSAISAFSRMSHSTLPYKLINGVTIANNWNDLTDGILQNSINVTEKGTTIATLSTWTGTNVSGGIYLPTAGAEGKCYDWTRNDQGISSIGGGEYTDYRWTELQGGTFCAIFRHLYCFEQ